MKKQFNNTSLIFYKNRGHLSTFEFGNSLKDLKHESYRKALFTLNLETLEERREYLCLKFTQKCTKNEKNTENVPTK